VWLFCVAFKIDEESKEIVVEHMLSLETEKPGVFKTAMTGSRADLEESWLFESKDKIPSGKSYGDVDDPDDLPQFYLLDKFKPEDQFSKDSPDDAYYKVANQFRRGNKKENYHNMVKDEYGSKGFTSDLFFTLEDTEGSEGSEEPKLFKWTLADEG